MADMLPKIIEAAKKTGNAYEALCDISAGSCSAVLGSSYAHILSHWGLVTAGGAFDVSNAAMGLLFYVAALSFDWWLAPLPVNPAATHDGDRWFTSAPMCDGFITLAKARAAPFHRNP